MTVSGQTSARVAN